MLPWPASVRSAVFIDFENFPIAADALASWIAWLEDGRFHHGRRRRLAVRRVYWNSAAERNRDRYEAAGFDVVLCDKYANRKNGADIRMAVDIVEAIHTQPRLDEFILITVDSDFVPVLQRLQARGKRSVVLVDEQRPDLHTICRRHADVLIPLRRLAEARTYQRVPGRLEALWTGVIERAARRLTEQIGPEATPKAAAVAARAPAEATAQPALPFLGPSGLTVVPVTTPAAPTLPELAPAPPALREASPARTIVSQPKAPQRSSEPPPAVPSTSAGSPIDDDHPPALPRQAVDSVLQVMSKRTGQCIARGKIIRELRQVPGFSADGGNAFFGYGGYRAFMLELARIEPRLHCDGVGDGLSVKLLPLEPRATRKSKRLLDEEDWPQAWEEFPDPGPEPVDPLDLSREPGAPPDPWREPGDWESTLQAAAEAAELEPAPHADGAGRKAETALPALRVVSNDR